MPSSAHHYHFAHTFLRQLAFAKPVELLEALDSPRCEGLLTELLRITAKTLGEAVPCAFGASDIKVSCLLLKNRPCAILQMPEPTEIAEAYFVAIWCRYESYALADEAIASPPANQPLIDYFTLERPSKPTPEWPTCFCSWSAEGAHRNFGLGPFPSYEEFVQFLTGFKPRQRLDDDFPPIEE